jgi:hypothetical protein
MFFFTFSFHQAADSTVVHVKVWFDSYYQGVSLDTLN